MVVWVDNKKVKERKRLIFPGLCREPIKLLTQGLHRSQRHREPSWGGEGTGCLLEGVLEAQAGGWIRRISALQIISRGEREREKERERERTKEKYMGKKKKEKYMGTQALMEQRCFNYLSVSIYRLWYKKFLLTMIKIRKPNVHQLLPSEQGIIMVTRSGDNPYLKREDRDWVILS